MNRRDRSEKTARAGNGRATLRTRHPWLMTAGALMIMALSSAGQALGQALQQKDLSFPQVVAGVEFESVISVTNCGDAPYTGAAHFWKGVGQDWNPEVNGIRITNSRLQLIVEPGQTKILRISDDSLTSGVVAILAGDSSQDNFIEGHLTYSNQGASYDSVGIAPAVELYRSVVPFEDFAAVGLALANANPNSRAVVRLRLLDELGSEHGRVDRELLGRSHEARFLSEIFPAEVEAGKVEIESDLPILGTALTLVRGEISALPMLPSPVAYTIRFSYQGRVDEAEASLWAEGVFVKGYLRFLVIDGRVNVNPATYLVTGTFEDGVLRVIMLSGGSGIGGTDTINSLKVQDFSFDTHSYTGGFRRIFPWLTFPFSQVLGNYELVRRD